MNSLRISEVRLVPARPEQIESGLEGFVSFVLDGGLMIDGLTLRRTRRGLPALSYPSRRDRRDREHALVRPLSDEVRKAIERQVFQALSILIDDPSSTTAHSHSDRRKVPD